MQQPGHDREGDGDPPVEVALLALAGGAGPVGQPAVAGGGAGDDGGPLQGDRAAAGVEVILNARGLAVVSDDGALIAAIDEALAAQPDVMAKIKDGKVQAAGAIIGAVMKAMKGQADAARVRELILERAAQ